MDRIWNSLKYEVRNGEIEDTIWCTLEVLKSLTTRLKDDNLRDYTLNVTRDCVGDLSNTIYVSAAGRLLVSVLSAKPSAFVLMVTPTITHIKENLRHPKAPKHSQDLLTILRVILETRLLLVDTEMSSEDREDFAAVDGIFKTLYNDVYKAPVQLGSKPDSSYDDLKVATEAVSGAGALVCQQPAKSLNLPSDTKSDGSERLLPGGTCSEICESLFNILAASATSSSRSSTGDDLVNETTKAVQRAVRVYPSAFKPMISLAIEALDSACQQGGNSHATSVFSTLASQLAFIGCSELPKNPSEGLSHFLYFIQTLLSKLYSIFDKSVNPKVWCAVAAAIQSAVRSFNDACLISDPGRDLDIGSGHWVETIANKYPELNDSNERTAQSSDNATSGVSSVAEIRSEFLLVSLFVVRQLYRGATKPVESHQKTGKQALALSESFNTTDQAAENQYLHLISTLAGFITQQFSESQQLSLKLEEFAVNLFRNDFISVPEALSEEQKLAPFDSSIYRNGSMWSWLVLERPNILSLGPLESLRPAAVARLVSSPPSLLFGLY